MMVDLIRPHDDEYLSDFRVGVDFSVTARDIGEAKALVQQALQGDSPDGIPVIARDRQVVDEDQIWGVLDWQQVPPRPSQAALVQDRYPGLVNDVAAMEMLQAMVQAGDRPVALPDLVPEETRERVGELVASLNREVMADDPDSPGRLVYEGPAADAAGQLAEGTYRAFDDNDREYALVVAPSELAPLGRVSQAIPKDRHDSRTLDEIAGLLRDHTRDQSLPDLFRQVNRRLETTRRAGFASWMPLDSEPAPAPARVHVGIIVWTDLEDQEPTVLVDSDPVRLTRNLATTLHENLDGDPGFEGAAEFLEQHKRPSQWQTPEDVDAWLQAINESTPYPAVSIQQLTVGAAPPGVSPAEPPIAETHLASPAATSEPVTVQERVVKRLFSYQVLVDFSVSAHTAEEARQIVDDALVGGAEPATPAVVQRGQQVMADGDIKGVLGWEHPEDSEAWTPVQESDPLSAVLQERAGDLDPSAGDSEQSPDVPWRDGERRESL